MESLIIKGSSGVYYTPGVDFQADTGKCSLSGESYLEETWDFYDQLLNWLRSYMETVKGPIYFEFRLTYFNTSSSKCILEIVKLLKKYQDEGGEVELLWYYPEGDDDILEEAEDFEEFVGIPVKTIAY